MRVAEGQRQQQPRGARRDHEAGDAAGESRAAHSRRGPARRSGARDAPIARRTAVCVRDARPRAPAAGSRRSRRQSAARARRPPSRIWRLRPYSSFITPTPAPAGTTLITCRGSSADHVGHPVGGIAGIVLDPLTQHVGEPRRHSVDRGARLAAARSTRSHARDRLVQQGAVTVDERLLLQRDPEVGRIAARVSPKKPGGATPITVKGCPSRTNVERHD